MLASVVCYTANFVGDVANDEDNDDSDDARLMPICQDSLGKLVPECLTFWILLELKMVEIVVTTGDIG